MFTSIDVRATEDRTRARLSRKAFVAAAVTSAVATALARPARAGVPINMLIIGDSVDWGQGLVPGAGQKMQELLAQRWAPTYDLEVRTLAHSGAIIGYDEQPGTPKNWNPEVPQSYPSLFDQLHTVQKTMPVGGYDFVLVCGGINDVNVEVIFNPATSAQKIQQRVTTYIYDGLGSLLKAALPIFTTANPNVVIGVCCYYHMVSKDSHFPSLHTIAQSLERDARSANGNYPNPQQLLTIPVLPKMVTNAETFTQESHVAITSVVLEANANAPVDALGNRMETVFLIDPKIDDAHAAMTATPYLWGVDALGNPQDPYHVQRAAFCQAAHETGLDRYTCQRASVGHPNLQGAAAYADAIDDTVGAVLRARIAQRSQSSPAPVPSAPPPVPVPSAAPLSTVPPFALPEPSSDSSSPPAPSSSR